MVLLLPKAGLRVLRKWHVLRRKRSVGHGIGRRGHSLSVYGKKRHIIVTELEDVFVRRAELRLRLGGHAASSHGLPAGGDGGRGALLLEGTGSAASFVRRSCVIHLNELGSLPRRGKQCQW